MNYELTEKMSEPCQGSNPRPHHLEASMLTTKLISRQICIGTFLTVMLNKGIQDKLRRLSKAAFNK